MRLAIGLLTILMTLVVAPMTAYADIVFVNMNGSTTEIPAARAVTHQTGEKLYVLPEQNSPGYTTEQLTQDLVRLAKLGVRPRAMIISGHHVKNQGYFGTNGEVSLHRIFQLMPREDSDVQAYFASLQSLYLWGCYTGTLTNADRLLRGYGTPFVNTKYVVGFADKAPLSTVPASGQVLKDMLLRESQFRASSPEQTLQLVRQVSAFYKDKYDFIVHKGSAFATKEGHSEVNSFIAKCQAETGRKGIVDSVSTFWKYYWNEVGPLPEETGKGPLREAYLQLQKNTFCIQMGSVELNKGVDIPSLSTVIRLIYFKNVIQNFARIYSAQLEFAKKEMEAIGLPSVEFITQLPQTERGEAMKNLELLHKGIKKIFPNFKSDVAERGQYLYFNSMINDIESVIYPSAEYVPQSWIELDTKEISRFSILNDFTKGKNRALKKAQSQLGKTQQENAL